MKGFLPTGALRRSINNQFGEIRRSRFFADRLSLGMLTGTVVINALNLFWLILHVHATEGLVPIRFSSLYLFDALGPWYYPYLIVLFAAAVSVANGAFAYNSFSRSRLGSFFLLSGAGVVAIFAAIISTAFGVVR